MDGGQIVATGAASFSFEYRYTLNVVVTDYAGDIATLIVPMMAYLRTNQPEILENPQIRENAFKFQIDYNNNNTADISFEIQLTERVVSKKDGNNVQIHYAKEPVWDEPNRVKVYLENRDSPIFEGDTV
ncbi:probable bacteriophage tail completion protein gpR homolog [Haemophilus influenzae 86-028NP]|uniref:Probable bacteriophage tail completion protein gpR homolog n=1 Tax=Haemophilus influenzae (strain 86-028NP) TaxID=281310 RepID=Q4QK12_HAEI8|nr:probable bacteriophage tail completion protein gpR homolog [Haemophilus influenzae 86-028NP]MCK8797615.1 phage tail protein [Haemophilus influenzae]